MVPCHAHLTSLLFYRSSQQQIPQTTHGATSSDRLFSFCEGLPLFFALFILCLPVCLPLRNYSLTHPVSSASHIYVLSFRVLLSHSLWNKWHTDITGDFIIRRFLRRFCSCFFTMWHWHQTGKRHGTILQWLISIWWCTSGYRHAAGQQWQQMTETATKKSLMKTRLPAWDHEREWHCIA